MQFTRQDYEAFGTSELIERIIELEHDVETIEEIINLDGEKFTDGEVLDLVLLYLQNRKDGKDWQESRRGIFYI